VIQLRHVLLYNISFFSFFFGAVVVVILW